MIKIYQAGSFGQAQYRVHITEQKSNADLLVYLVSNPALATGNGQWYVTNQYEEANRKVLFCNKSSAQFSICFVNSRGEAGWQKPTPLQHAF